MRMDRCGRKIAAMNHCNPLTRRATPFTRLLVAGALCLTAASPAWADHAPAQDLRSPDARDAARLAESQDSPSAVKVRVYRDLRSPDARDAARLAESQDSPSAVKVRVYRDLRSPTRATPLGRPPPSRRCPWQGGR